MHMIYFIIDKPKPPVMTIEYNNFSLLYLSSLKKLPGQKSTGFACNVLFLHSEIIRKTGNHNYDPGTLSRHESKLIFAELNFLSKK